MGRSRRCLRGHAVAIERVIGETRHAVAKLVVDDIAWTVQVDIVDEIAS